MYKNKVLECVFCNKGQSLLTFTKGIVHRKETLARSPHTSYDATLHVCWRKLKLHIYHLMPPSCLSNIVVNKTTSVAYLVGLFVEIVVIVIHQGNAVVLSVDPKRVKITTVYWSFPYTNPDVSRPQIHIIESIKYLYLWCCYASTSATLYYQHTRSGRWSPQTPRCWWYLNT